MRDIDVIHRALQAAVGPNRVPGVVAAAATTDGVIFEAALGRRSITQPEPMTTDSVFRMASMTKPITAAAAMQLVEQGRLSLDRPAREILPALSETKVLIKAACAAMNTAATQPSTACGRTPWRRNREVLYLDADTVPLVDPLQVATALSSESST